jgi:hypothetical protein
MYCNSARVVPKQAATRQLIRGSLQLASRGHMQESAVEVEAKLTPGPHQGSPSPPVSQLPIDGRWESAHWGARPHSGNACRLNRSMQHSSNRLIRWCFSKTSDPLGCTQLNLNRAVFSLNQRSRTNLANQIPADRTSGECCVDPLRPPDLSGCGRESSFKEDNGGQLLMMKCL